LAGAVTWALLPAPAVAAPSISGEFPVSQVADNNKLVQGPEGRIWVTLSGATNDVARIDPTSGEVKEFGFGPFVKEPLGIAVAGGQMWITSEGLVTHFDPENPAAFEFVSIPALGATQSIVAGQDGNLWAATEGRLLRFPPGAGSQITDNLKEIALAGFNARDIDVAGPSLAIADRGGSRVLVATPANAANAEFTEFKLAGGPQGVAGAPNGQIAFTEGTEFGLLTPPGPPQLTPAPGFDSFGVTLGPDGAFWIAQTFLSESVVRLDAKNRSTTLSPGFAKDSHPRQITAGPANTLWVTLPGVNKVGRVIGVAPLSEPPAEPPKTQGRPQTRMTGGPKGSIATMRGRTAVRFSFSSPAFGPSFQCRLLRRGSKPPRFTGCRSPKSYRVKPGSYRFEVRAVLNGVADRTPASRSFRVIRVAVGSG
jgi:streptogramin lyase